jgi:hypothetical protein
MIILPTFGTVALKGKRSLRAGITISDCKKTEMEYKIQTLMTV